MARPAFNTIRERRPEAPTISSIRALTPADLEMLRQPAVRTTVKTLRDSHHAVAWHLAMGETVEQVAVATGYSMGRVSFMKTDPAFKELLAEYQADIRRGRIEHSEGLASLAATNMLKAERQIGDALDDADLAGTPLPIRDLARIASDRMDRFGYPKHSLSDNRNININFAAKLEDAINRSRKVLE